MNRKKNFLSFVDGQFRIGICQLASQLLFRQPTEDLERELSNNLASHFLAEGAFVFYSSARAGLLSFLVAHKVGDGDEVLVTGATCSVVIDAIRISGASPIFVDVDESSYGTSTLSLLSSVTTKTKLVIVQHSFGIPSDAVDVIPELQAKGIFVIEDCALSLGSKRHGRRVGTFGDASIISFGHSKPINGFVGGALFSTNPELISKVKSQTTTSRLHPAQRALSLTYAIIEHFLCRANRYRIWQIALLATGLIQRVLPFWQPFLSSRGAQGTLLPISSVLKSMPRFALILANASAAERARSIDRRKSQLQIFLTAVPIDLLPGGYLDCQNQIDPFRFIFYAHFRRDDLKLASRLDVSQMWFKSPIEATNLSLAAHGYNDGDCPMSELLASRIINLPSHTSDAILRDSISYATGAM